MECQHCHRKDELFCRQCYNAQQEGKSEKGIQAKLTEARAKVTQKMQLIGIQQILKKNERQKKIAKIQSIKAKIQQLNQNVNVQRSKISNLQKIKKYLQQKFTIDNAQDGRELYLQNLITKNEALHEKIIYCKKQKKKMIQQFMKVNRLDEKKYQIQKYYKLENNQNISFTCQNEKSGIPVIKANNQQVIKYHPFEEKDESQRREEQKRVIQAIKLSFKLAFILHKIFLNSVKLPFKLYFFREYFYLGNLLIIFDQKQTAGSQLMGKAINMLQADLQYISYVFGYSDKPLIILNKSFLDHIESIKFRLVGFSMNKRKWNSFLRLLKAINIQQEHDEQFESPQLIFLRSDDVSVQISKKGNQSDEQFEILQMNE